LLVLGWVGVAHVAEKLWRKGGNSWKHTLWSRVYGVAYAKSVGIVETDNCNPNEKASEHNLRLIQQTALREKRQRDKYDNFLNLLVL